jgi:hypothetical protein
VGYNQCNENHDTESHKDNDEMKPEYDFSLFKGAVRGKYYKRAMAGTNLVVIQPDVFEVFPSSEAVNAALREVIRRKNRNQSTRNGTRRRRRRSV